MEPLPSRVMFVADAAHSEDLPALVARAVGAGIRFVELRRTSALEIGTRARLREATAVRRAAPAATLLVNDRVDVALACGADGAHVGQDDLPARQARSLLGPEALLGLSTHDETQLRSAQDLPLSYVALGPVFRSRTKSGHAAELGLDGLRALRPKSRLPLVAIGGIDAANAASVLDAGADCVAVASAISCGDVEASVRGLLLAAGEDPLARPWLLAGFSGAGKSTVGRRLAALSGRRFVDLDELIGPDRVVDLLAAGEAGLRDAEERALARALRGPARSVVALGGGTLLGAGAAALAREGLLAWLETPWRECLRRCDGDSRRRPLLEEARGQGDPAVLRLVEARRRAADWADAEVDASGAPDDVARNLLRLLQDAERRPRRPSAPPDSGA